MLAGSGTSPPLRAFVGWNAATVWVPPSITEAFPDVKLVASVLMTNILDVVPARTFAESGGLKLNPTTVPAAFLSAVTGATVPATNGPTASMRYPVRS